MNVYPHVKRCADAALSLAALVCLSPVFALIAAAVKLSSPGPVLFRQQRAGRGGRLFTIYKFRTMRTDTPRDTATHLLNDPGRYITPVGAFLRRSSLDELPVAEKVRFDREYVENLSLRMDMRCFFGSFIAVLRADGVREGSSETEGKRRA